MIGRRDLLKYFGAGAVIAPVVDGIPLLGEPAKLVEPPKLIEVAPLIARQSAFTVNDVDGLRDLLDASAPLTSIGL